MNYTRVYNEISATYGEVAWALKKLGFQDVSTSEKFRFVNDKHNSEVKLPARLLDAPFAKANLAGYSYQLYMQGVIKHTDDLAKQIEKNRLLATTQEQVT
jgi:predicted DNA binding CopG/RHH family protein